MESNYFSNSSWLKRSCFLSPNILFRFFNYLFDKEYFICIIIIHKMKLEYDRKIGSIINVVSEYKAFFFSLPVILLSLSVD
jgi:hypothetical protein